MQYTLYISILTSYPALYIPIKQCEVALELLALHTQEANPISLFLFPPSPSQEELPDQADGDLPQEGQLLRHGNLGLPLLRGQGSRAARFSI